MGSSHSALNFGAGPAKLPREVLAEVQTELLSYQDSGMSLMEMSHRGKEYTKINNDAQKAIRELLNVPDNYKVLFMQGGGTGAFAAVALNLMNRTGVADYAVTGTWSSKAAKEAAKYGKVNLVFPKADKPGSIPPESSWTLNPDASYVYYCDNETVDGVEFPFIPTSPHGVPIVSDMSSSIMTKKIDISKFGCIVAGAQKNIGPAGVTVVIIREDLLGNPMKICPTVFDFTVISQQNSVHNTPATFSVYVMEKVLQWIKKNGGLQAMENQSQDKSKLLYEEMENSNNFYSCPIDENCRSRINVPFRVGGPQGNEELEAKFLEEAEKLKMFQLKGHRLVGGIRASLYNAVTRDEVALLVKFMKEFRAQFS
ncbi:probable phosphoserine aminotransferase [Tribolium castaneum]|uniref:Phosphoserine aminotransferase n=1 Tax=Tribolium castaneum TaxID=7070 RepID=D6W9Q3_TRICA|nr:PREDICTED: probable phosphoserine aminotransferase [Tribolium castaneum]EEZ98123.1 putative phosphoserine aminotransferase-like Protein [Tribolium castaneum]|eukprot:XP_974471.1 PREDICTED: probable phosphoserine aminotransferase [Tribolium castaneum]